MAMRFGILGALTVWLDGRPLPLGSSKQRLLCATLLLNANEVLSTDYLADMLWGDPQPASAAANLRTYAHGLRRTLETPTGRPRLHRRTGGYLLEVGPDELDLVEFQAVAARGRDALAAGDLAAAETSLETALRLWRGTPLAELPLPPLLAQRVAQLEEERLLTEEDWVEARLSLGASADLVGRLRKTAEEHPLRQRTWGQLMVALYRTGDVAGAVAAYRRARQTLADETGLDPSPALDQIYQDVLNHNPQLTDTAPARSRSPLLRPPMSELPPSPAALVGRQPEIATVLSWLGDAPERSVVALHGPGGVGKSALAVRIASQLADRYPGGTLYVDLQGADANLGPLHPVDVVRRFLRALGVPGNAVPSELGEAVAAYRSEIAGRGLLAVLDNAHNAAQVKPLLPVDPSCAAIVTSRQMLATLPNSHHLAIGLLPTAQAVTLLEADCGADRVAAQPSMATRLVELCGHLPLAIRIVGARLASRPEWPLSSFADRLADPAQRLDELEYDDLSVRASVRIAYTTMERGDPRDQRCARAFRLIGAVPIPQITVRAVASLLGEPTTVAQTALDRLADQRLVDPRRPGTYGIHDLLRLYAHEQAGVESDTERQAAVERLIETYLLGARRVEQLANAGWSPTPEEASAVLPWQDAPATPAEATAWLADEHANLVELFTQASTMPGDTPRLAARLAWASVAVLHRHGYRHEAFTVIDGAVSVTTRLGMTLELGAALFYRAQLTKGAGNADAVEADLARCLELTRSLGNQARISACLDSLGNLRYRQGEPVEALVFHEEALAVRRALGLPLPIGASLSNMAQVRFDNGQVAEAFEGVDEALKLAREIGATGLEGAALSMRGRLLCRTGHWADSLSSLTEAIVCTEATNDLHTRCEAHLTRVATHLGRDDHEAALRDATRAEDLAMRVGDHYLRAVARWAASRAYAAAGDEASARQLAEQARELGRPVSAYREPMYEHFFGSLPTAP